MDNYENNLEDEMTENRDKKSYWPLCAIIASLMAIISLFGIWYVNNERLFTIVENTKLRVEVTNLKEEIESLRTNLAQENSQAADTNQKADTIKEQDKETEDDYYVYEVKSGDSLNSISLSLLGTEMYAINIAELNDMNPESILQVGQTLKIPKKPIE